MKKQIVLGTFFGDEGKGSTVQWLCSKAIAHNEKALVIRYSGGPQAGHRIIDSSGREHVCSSFGSGCLLGIPTYLASQVMVDPICIKEEYDKLNQLHVRPVLYINRYCRVITPYDVLANLKDRDNMSNGSCGMGIYQTYYRNEHQTYTLPNFLSGSKVYLESCREFHSIPENKELEYKFNEALNWLKSYAKIVNDMPTGFDTLIFEGSQGLLLDMNCGFMPHCTPTKVGLNGIAEDYELKRFLPKAEVYFVMRNYLTRHGNGYSPYGESIVDDLFTLNEPTNPDDGPQGVFKYGLFETRLLQKVFQRHCIDNYCKIYNLKCNAVITHMDSTEKYIPLWNGESVTLCSKELFSATVERILNKSVEWHWTIYESYSPQLSDKQFLLCWLAV